MDIDGLKAYVESCINKSKNAAEIARKCGISTSALSLFINGKYGAKVDSIAKKIATGLNFYDEKWVVVDSIYSYKQVHTIFASAKERSLWIPISSKAGSGKTQPLVELYNTSADNSVIYIKCRKWHAKLFLTKLASAMGVSIEKCKNCDQIIDVITSHINKMSDKKPILLIDDISKLHDDALFTLIPIYDDTIKKLGMIPSGTETFERRIKRGIGKIDGYDELDSRFGRNYIDLKGATQDDVSNICKANGIQNEEAIEDIWNNIEKKGKVVKRKGQDVKILFVDDLRRLSREIESRLIQSQIAAGLIL